MLSSRRGFLAGMASLFAAPAVVRADSIMRIKPLSNVWVYDAGLKRWSRETSGLYITDQEIRWNFDVFDKIMQSIDLDNLTHNPWLDAIESRIKAHKEDAYSRFYRTGNRPPASVLLSDDVERPKLFGMIEPGRAERDDFAERLQIHYSNP